MTIIAQAVGTNSSRDYDWLKDSVAKWNGNRSDLAALIPDFVMLAEKQINGDLDASAQEVSITLAAPAATPSVTLPDDTGRLISLSVIGGDELDYVAPAVFNSQKVDGDAGKPRTFTVIGREVFLGPVPDADYTLLLAYRQYVPALADSAGSNWLIEKHPEVYLAACMVETIYYTKNFADLANWAGKYEAAMEALNNSGSFTGSMRVHSDAKIV